MKGKTLLNLVPAVVAKVLDLAHVPAKVRPVVTHVVLVFVTAFAAQLAFPVLIRAVGAGTLHWSALAALLCSAASAGASAVGHYLTGLIPAKPSAA